MTKQQQHTLTACPCCSNEYHSGDNPRMVKAIQQHTAALTAAREALEDTLRRIEDSEEWWMDSPDRGGMDADKLRAALAQLRGEQV